MPSLQILVVDDEPAIRQVLAAFLTKAGYMVQQAANGAAALEILSRGDVDVAFCDINMPDINGIELLRAGRASGIDTAFIMITAYASVDTAIEAMKAGAADYMIKPLHNEEVLQRLGKVADMRVLRAENRVLRGLVLGDKENVCQFSSPQMGAMMRLIDKVAPTDSTVLITGESGTGKGVAARLIHQKSLRADAPFIPVNCGAIPENLVESELCGHTKGAFTGADKARKGLFLEAEKGTIFLDEIGELPLHLQVKLLHIIEEKAIRPVGGAQSRHVDVRIIAATNRNLQQLVGEGRFREDLFFRLSVFHVHVPSLRERREDIPLLLKCLLQQGARRHGCGSNVSIEADAEAALLAYDWPGNVREMSNVIDRALILADEGRITRSDLPIQIAVPAPADEGGLTSEDAGGSLREQTRRFEASAISRAINDAKGDRRLASQKLGIGLSSLYRKLEEFESLGLLADSEHTRQEVRQG